MTNDVIEDARPGDESAIRELTERAFAPIPFSDGSEPDIPRRLRADGDLTHSIVMRRDGAIVGHAAFSPVRVENDHRPGWFGLGPVSVEPDCQRVGIGSALIEEGLRRLRSDGARGCVLIGDPAYYSRFGFRSGGIMHGTVPSQYVQWLSFSDDVPSGEVTFAPAFGATS